MGCNCKGKKQVINNLNSKDHLILAQTTYNELVEGKAIEDISDLDWIEIRGVYGSLYPNATGEPTKQQMIDELINAIIRYEVNYGKKR
jgi:hypothetical protein